jgi:putative ABC transport system permease protein
LTVKAIAKNSPLTGVLDATINPGMVVPLGRMQEATGQQDQLSFIGVSNTGDVRGGLERSDAVVDALEPALEGTGLGIDAIKQNLIEQTELASSGLTGLFLVLGLFSISVGILLIILIFAMLAAERRPEMGMARAVGQQRRQLIQQFIAEGAGYAILSGLVGAAIGVGVTYVLGFIFGQAIGDFFKVEAVVTPRSAVIGYCLGVVITFVAVIFSSGRASRLNVVAAIRDIPDNPVYHRNRRVLFWGIVMVVIGLLLFLLGMSTDILAFHGIGLCLTLFGIAFVSRYFGASARLVFSIVGILTLVYWLLPSDIFEAIFGEMSGDFELFFISGIFMVAGATLLITQNLDSLLGVVSRIGGLFPGKLPSVRLAIAYPGAAKGRTGLTVAMFSLIVFSLVCFATISENFANLFLSDEADAGWDIQVEVPNSNPIPDKDLVAALNANGADTSDITAVGWSDLAAPQATIRQDGVEDDDPVDIMVTGMDSSLISESDLSFQARAEGYPDNQAIVDALLNEPGVAVIDSSAVQASGGFGAPEAFHIEGVDTDQEVFPAVNVSVTDPRTGQPAPLKIIAIIDSDISTMFGLFTNRTFTDQVFPDAALTSYRVRISDTDNVEDRAEDIERALLNNGAQAISYDEILEQGQAQFRGFLYLIQGFMGLGLVVGIAAVGVLAFRAVVERRQQIGMLRALGFQKAMVAQSFLFETIFVVALGVLSGTILALALAWQLFSDEEFTGGQDAEFIVPWPLVFGILIIAFVMALVMTWVPSRQAASVPPAEALRWE